MTNKDRHASIQMAYSIIERLYYENTANEDLYLALGILYSVGDSLRYLDDFENPLPHILSVASAEDR